MKWASGGPRHGHASHKQPSCADCWCEEAGAERARADQAEAEVDRLTEALRDLHAEVEGAEAIGICLPDRVPSLIAGEVLREASDG